MVLLEEVDGSEEDSLLEDVEAASSEDELAAGVSLEVVSATLDEAGAFDSELFGAVVLLDEAGALDEDCVGSAGELSVGAALEAESSQPTRAAIDTHKQKTRV